MSKKKVMLWFMVLVLAIMTFTGCDAWNKLIGKSDDESNTTDTTTTDTPTVTYSISDLEGTWGVEDESATTVFNMTFIFDAQGNLTSITGPPNIISVSGSISVTEAGVVSGTGSMERTSDVENNIVDSTTMSITGNFVTKTKIGIKLDCSWTSSDGNSGVYSISSDVVKK